MQESRQSDERFLKAVKISETSDIVERSHPVRWFAAALILLVIAWFLYGVARNPAFGWPVFAHYFTSAEILKGLWLTIWLTAVVMALGFAFGLVIAVMRLSKNPVLQAIAWAYVWLFRSLPLLVLLLFWFNISYLFPTIAIGVPFGPVFYEVETQQLISTMGATIIAFTLHEAAYASEIIRGGILSVDHGQDEAADALAIPKRRALFRVILPQAMRSIIPASASLLIGTFKNTSIASVVAVTDLLYSAQIIYNRNYEIVPLLMVATVWYILITSIISVVQYFVEAYFGRGLIKRSEPGLLKTYLATR
ncbi:MAG: amino acid ABC transporter permease [Myxococcota bacterium]|jgi:polar amino acid transport system permease protein